MSYRDTREEAEQSLARLQQSDPNATIIIKTSGDRFAIVEVVKCDRCGADVHTHCIGEWMRHYCEECEPIVQAEREAEKAQRAAEARERSARRNFYS